MVIGAQLRPGAANVILCQPGRKDLLGSSFRKRVATGNPRNLGWPFPVYTGTHLASVFWLVSESQT
jgi:hypothetical protein